MKKKKILVLGIVIIFVFTLGWFSNNAFYNISQGNLYQPKILGLWMSGYTEEGAIERAYERDTLGKWVFVNIANLDWEESLEVCKHEVGHEIFAEYCKDNIDKCMELAKNEKEEEKETEKFAEYCEDNINKCIGLTNE